MGEGPTRLAKADTGCAQAVSQIAFSAPGSLLRQAGNLPAPHAQDTFSCGPRE